MNYKELLEQIKKKKIDPVYCLHGDEPWFIDQLADAIEENAMPEADRAFNQSILYGKDVDARSVIDAARRFPMMAERTLVLLREAQDMKSLPDLLPYLEKPTPSTILVICHKNKKIDTRTKFGKSAQSLSVCFESKPLYDNNMPEWIADYLRQKRYKLMSDVSNALADYLGTDLSKVSNELDKLCLNVPENGEITMELVRQIIADSRSFNVFDLQKALGARDGLKIRRIIHYFVSDPREAPLPMLISSLYNFFSKLYQLSFLVGQPDGSVIQALQLRNAYFLKDYRAASSKFNRRQLEQIIHILSDYDLRSKGVNNDSTDYEALLTELCWKISHS